MRKLVLYAATCLLIPGVALGQAAATEPADTLPAPPATAEAAPGTVGSNTTLTLGGKVDLHIAGKPTLTTPDGVVYELIGDQASTIAQLEQIDDKVIVVSGQVLKDGDKPTLNLSILSFWVVGSSSAIGTVPAGTQGDAAKVTPVITLWGALGTKVIGKPDLTTPEGKVYTLIGPQVATLESLDDLNRGMLEINGQLVDNDGRMDVVVLSFRLMSTRGGPNGKGTIGASMPGESGAANTMEPSVTIEGILTTNLVNQPDLKSKDGKTYRLIGPEVSIIGATEGIDGKQVAVTGQLMTNGKFENLVVSSYIVREPAPAAPPMTQPAPLINPATGAPPIAVPADPQRAPVAVPKL